MDGSCRPCLFGAALILYPHLCAVGGVAPVSTVVCSGPRVLLSRISLGPCEDESVLSAAETEASHEEPASVALLASVLVFVAGLVVAVLGLVLCRSDERSLRRWADDEDEDDAEPPAVGGRQSRIVGEVRIGKPRIGKPRKDEHERLNLMAEAARPEGEDEENLDMEGLATPRLGLPVEQI